MNIDFKTFLATIVARYE